MAAKRFLNSVLVSGVFCACVVVSFNLTLNGGLASALKSWMTLRGETVYSNWTPREDHVPLPRALALVGHFDAAGKTSRADVLSSRSFGTPSLLTHGQKAELNRRAVQQDLSTLSAELALAETDQPDTLSAKELASNTLMMRPKMAWRGGRSGKRHQRSAYNEMVPGQRQPPQ